MVALVTPDRSLDKVPTEWIYKTDSDLVYFHLILFSFHQVFEEIRILYFLFRHYLGIQLINVQLLNQVYA